MEVREENKTEEADGSKQDRRHRHHRRRHRNKHRKRTSDIDVVIAKCVQEIWQEYDDDNSGSLDKEETRQFVKNTLGDMDAGGKGMSDEEFEQCFIEFDEDGSGTIEKHEMIAFIRNITGLW